jgi:hypothetical protein
MGMAVTVTADTAMEAMAMEAMAITVTEGMAMEVTVTVMAIMAITTVITPIGTTITGTIITGMATVGGGAGAGMAMGLEPAGLGRRMAIGGFATKFSERRTHYQTASGRASWGRLFFAMCAHRVTALRPLWCYSTSGAKTIGGSP